MILKERVESDELKMLKSLNARTILTKEERRLLISLDKGYEGERQFDQWALPLNDQMVFLNDLLLEHQGSPFQIDSCAVASRTIFHFEVKNFEGDYRISDGNWLSPVGEEKKDPLLQLKRANSLIRQLTKKAGFNYSVESYLIFINPEFYLYNPPDIASTIFYPQLNRFMKKLLDRSLTAGKADKRLADKLLSLHQEDSAYSRLPKYEFGDLQKGILCPNCYRFYDTISKKALTCSGCRRSEPISEAILRTVEEFRLLFPGEKVTTSQIYNMCEVISHKKTIRKVLSENFVMKGFGKHAYYVKDNLVIKKRSLERV